MPRLLAQKPLIHSIKLDFRGEVRKFHKIFCTFDIKENNIGLHFKRVADRFLDIKKNSRT